MALLDFSEVLLDPDFTDRFSVVRRKEIVSQQGRVGTEDKIFANLLGVVTMASPNDLKRLPDYQFNTRVISIVARFPFRGESTGYQPDIINWRADKYLIIYIDLYPQFGTGFYQILAESIQTTDSALLPDDYTHELDFSVANHSQYIPLLQGF